MSSVGNDGSERKKFPIGFLIGVASSAYQIEGAHNVNGKGESIWDRVTHTRPSLVVDGTNADEACDSYRLYKRDVELIRDIGFHVYRFSVSWPRILPTGEPHIVNAAGVEYYNSLIDELILKSVQPMITMYHWDLPQPLQDLGGWLNPLISNYFVDYARLLFQLFGDRVKWWVTINEPEMVAQGYGSQMFAPCLQLEESGRYLSAHNMLISHAKVYRAYEAEFRSIQNGQVTIGLNAMYHWPKTESQADKDAAERAMQFQLGWFADPIFGTTGDYPEQMRKNIDLTSAKEGRSRSRLPTFTQEEISMIKGSCDFFGYQHYTSSQVAHVANSVSKDAQITYSISPAWKRSSIPWLKVVPEGFRESLNWIKSRYGNPTLLVTECGYGDYAEIDSLEDDKRIHYFQTYLEAMLNAIYVDGCNIVGFTAWSLLDNFEWFEGLRAKFGIVSVDFNSPDKTRTPKKSAQFFKNLLDNMSL